MPTSKGKGSTMQDSVNLASSLELPMLDHQSSSSEEEGELKEDSPVPLNKATPTSSIDRGAPDCPVADPKVVQNKRARSYSVDLGATALTRNQSPPSDVPSKRQRRSDTSVAFGAMKGFKNRVNCMLQVENYAPFGTFEGYDGIFTTVRIDPGLFGAPSLQLFMSTSPNARNSYKNVWSVAEILDQDWAITRLHIQPVVESLEDRDKRVISALPKERDLQRLVRIQFTAWDQVRGYAGLSNERVLKKGQSASVTRALATLFTPKNPFMLTIWILADRSHETLYSECWIFFMKACEARRHPLHYWTDEKNMFFTRLGFDHQADYIVAPADRRNLKDHHHSRKLSAQDVSKTAAQRSDTEMDMQTVPNTSSQDYAMELPPDPTNIEVNSTLQINSGEQLDAIKSSTDNETDDRDSAGLKDPNSLPAVVSIAERSAEKAAGLTETPLASTAAIEITVQQSSRAPDVSSSNPNVSLDVQNDRDAGGSKTEAPRQPMLDLGYKRERKPFMSAR